MLRYISAATLCLALLCTCTTSAGSAEQPGYVPITELRQAAAEGWHETITAHGREIAVALDIAVPAVDALPVLRVRAKNPLPDIPRERYTEYHCEPGYVRGTVGDLYAEEPPYGANTKEPSLYAGEAIDWDATAEENPTTAGEAYALLRQEIETAFGAETLDTFVPEMVTANTRIYYMDNATGYPSDDPFSEMGGLSIDCGGYVHGIRISGQVMYDGGNGRAVPPWGASLYLDSPSQYGFSISALEVVEVIAEDIPIRPLEDVKDTYRTLIAAGQLRHPQSLTLAYAMYADPQEDGIAWLIPTWMCEGEFFERAADERIIFDGEEMPLVYTSYADAQRLVPTDPLAMPMWTGGYEGDAPDRDRIIHWDDV